ncbi:hypothetical protein CGMCC3_g17846 [Colletotrichum fructicola]|nr:uncharacterized protein CGMCC3_g17846 [Colletotrichum fructicola]KAE9565977.1 hypothetical protein CGMCC3_g17846 [Colletotrichum fructicola]KAF4477881.1 hypothetical protein CGGC5_v013038 [Colletotrichum fructicola Nara gc5]KAF4481489.1 hypothetical protein CGGC5_v010283 [Colletotrichum fructicola Nara gc5]
MTAFRNAPLPFDVGLCVLDTTDIMPIARNWPAYDGWETFRSGLYRSLLPADVVRSCTARIEKASNERVRGLIAQVSACGFNTNGPDRIVGPLLVVAEAAAIKALYDGSYGLTDIGRIEDPEMGELIRTVTAWDGGIEPVIWSETEVEDHCTSMDYRYHYNNRKAVNTPSLEASYREGFNRQMRGGCSAELINTWFVEHAASIVLITKGAVAKNPEWLSMMKMAEDTPI